MIAPLDPELARVFATDEKFEERERRTHAAVVLESEEVLVWWAMERNEVRRSVVPIVPSSLFTSVLLVCLLLLLFMTFLSALFTDFWLQREVERNQIRIDL